MADKRIDELPLRSSPLGTDLLVLEDATTHQFVQSSVTTFPVSAPIQNALDAKESVAVRGQPNGYAALDATGKVPAAQLPPSATVNDKSYTQPFTAATTVAVAHNLGKRPSITVFDSAGDECEGTVTHVDINNVALNFSAPFSGTVICN